METNISKKQSLRELQQIPGVGPKLAQILYSLGIHSINDLVGKDPEQLYLQLCTQMGQHVDRCVLYVFRCAVYYASHDTHEDKLLQWWQWKD